MINPKQLNTAYFPELVLVVYKKTTDDPQFYDDSESPLGQDYYIESHQPFTTDGKIVTGSGKPLTRNTLKDLGAYFSKKKSKEDQPLNFSGLIPKNILKVDQKNGQYKICWYCKPIKRMLYFREELKIPCGNAIPPGLVFVASNSALSVFAVTSKAIKGSTELYHAPFHNVYQKGALCLGTAKPPKKGKYIEEMIEGWENTFFNSYFTHLNTNNSPVNGNINLIWKDVIKNEANFPSDVLIPCNRTINDLIK